MLRVKKNTFNYSCVCVWERERPSWCRAGKRVTRERGVVANEQTASAVRRARFSLAHVKYVQLQLQFAVQPAVSAAVCLPLSLQWFCDLTDILCLIMLRLKFSTEGIIFSLDIICDQVFSSCLISIGCSLSDRSNSFYNLLISVLDVGGYFCGPEQTADASIQNWVESLVGQYGNI